MTETSSLKAERLVKEGKVILTDKAKSGLIFSVSGSDSPHTVIYDYISEKISCDCRWDSVGQFQKNHQGEECSHVKAVRIWIGTHQEELHERK